MPDGNVRNRWIGIFHNLSGLAFSLGHYMEYRTTRSSLPLLNRVELGLPKRGTCFEGEEWLRPDESAPDCDHHRVGPVFDFQFLHQVSQVHFDGFVAHRKTVCNLFVAEPVSH